MGFPHLAVQSLTVVGRCLVLVGLSGRASDMRQLPWTGRFDRVINWSTAFGYFDDTTNRAVLDGIVRCDRAVGSPWTWTI